MNTKELKTILTSHARWKKDPATGKRAVLTLDNLREADLSHANFTLETHISVAALIKAVEQRDELAELLREAIGEISDLGYEQHFSSTLTDKIRAALALALHNWCIVKVPRNATRGP